MVLSMMVGGLYAATAGAVPAQLTKQGRLLDADGLPLEGEVSLTFRLHTDAVDDSVAWAETHDLTLNVGFYSAVLGADVDGNPLDIDVLNQAPLWVEVQVGADDPMTPRHSVGAVPYAGMVSEAESVVGGPVDATGVSIDGTAVIDGDGHWVGPVLSMGWADVLDRPEGFDDGVDAVLTMGEVLGIVDGSVIDLGDPSSLDGQALITTDEWVVPAWDTLEGVPDGISDGVDDDAAASLEVTCLDGYLPRWLGVTLDWDCSEDVDTVRSPEVVEGFVTDAPVDLSIGTTVAGASVATGSHASTLGWTAIEGVPEGFAEGVDDDTQLSASEVVGFITDAAIDLAAGTTLNGIAIATGEHIASLAWATVTDVPDGFADGIDDDTQLSADEVMAFVESEPMVLSSGSTIGGQPIAIGADLPEGTVAMWQGSGVPEGWSLCDGSDGTPDLRDRFVIGAGGSHGVGSTGGGPRSVSASTGKAKHHGSSGLTVVTSVSSPSALPPYYALSYIMKR